MPRPANIIRSIKLHLCVPEDIMAQVMLKLFSKVEGRVPKGAFMEYYLRLARQDLSESSLDISQYRVTTGNPIIRGDKATLEVIQNALSLHTITGV